jgi:integrase
VLAEASLSTRLKQEVASALNTAAKAMKLELAEAPAHPLYIRTRLKGFAPAMIDVSASRWANVLSLLRKALTIAGMADEYCRKRAPIAPVWDAALKRIEDKWLRNRLTAFARSASAMGIRLDEVTADTLEAYREHLEGTELVKTPNDIHRALCIAWNHAVETVPLWPQVRVEVPQYRKQYALDWRDFPESLLNDLEDYLHYLAGDDILTGCPDPLRPATIKGRRETLREYLTAIVLAGRDPATITCLADTVGLQDFETGLRFFLKRVPKTETASKAASSPKPADAPNGPNTPNAPKENKALALRVANMVLPIAKYWVRVPEPQLKAMREMRDRLREKRKLSRMGEKSRTRLKQFDDPKIVRALARLPLELIKKVDKDLEPEDTPSYRQALLYQQAVAIELGLRLVLRIENLANIEIGRHLTWTKNGVMHVAIPGHEVKNGVDITRQLPPSTAAMIETYRKRFRPVLCKRASDHLFPGSNGGAKQKGWLSKQISTCIKKEIGIEMHAHLFRHFAAKTYLDAHPGAYGVVKLLNGHRSVDTTAQIYADGSEAGAAYRHYDKLLESLRGDSRDRNSESEPRS